MLIVLTRKVLENFICLSSSSVTYISRFKNGLLYSLAINMLIWLTYKVVIIPCSQYAKLNFSPSPKSNKIFKSSIHQS